MTSTGKWSSYHTFAAILLLICLTSVFKNPFIYFKDYSIALGLSYFQYSIILLALYLGNITSLFFGIYVNNLFKEKYQIIASIFAFISGLLSLLYCLLSSFTTSNMLSSNTLSAFVVLYGSIIAFLYKNAASICYATVVGLANEYSPANSKGANMSLLQMSWAISTLLYIAIGFMLQYSFWYLPFLIFGIILILYTFIINWGYTFTASSALTANLRQIQQFSQPTDIMSSDGDGDGMMKAVSDVSTNFSQLTPEIRANIADLRSVFNKQIDLILLSVFFCGISQGSFLITTSSFWMEDVYDLDTSSVGLVTLSIFFAEIVGASIMMRISDTKGIFFCSFMSLGIEIAASFVILVLCIITGPQIGGLWLAVILNFCLFVGWEMFLIAQILAMIEFGPINVSKNVILLSNFAVASIAKMIGAELSTFLWYNGHGLVILSAIWLIANIFAFGAYSILYQIKDKRSESDYIPISDGDPEEPVLTSNTMNTVNTIHTNTTASTTTSKSSSKLQPHL